MFDAPTRPALRWHGGKWRLAPWIIGHFPEHRVYVEPYGGAASVLLRKPRSYAEIYNDLDDRVVKLFRILRSDRALELVEALRLTPFARTEFIEAYVPTEDDFETARQLVIRAYMGFGSDAHNPEVKTGFRANSNRSGSTPAHDWNNYPEALIAIIERFSKVVIESRPALMVMKAHDSTTTLHYVDPPYMPGTRSQKSRKGGAKYHVYAHEMTDEDHFEMLNALNDLKGMVVLSGYPSDAYSARLKGWLRIEKKALADGARPRTECLWLNPAATWN